MNSKKIFLLLFFFSGISFATLWAKNLTVTIAPLYTVTNDLTAGTDFQTRKILRPIDSPHNYRLKPSQISMILKSDLIIMVSEEFETFMEKLIDSKKIDDKLFFAEKYAKEILPIREDENFAHFHEHGHDEDEHEHEEHKHDEHMHDEHEHEEHGHEHEHEGHGGEEDLHLWMSPANMESFARGLVQKLATLSPKDSGRLQKNLETFLKKLEQKTKQIRTKFRKNPPGKFMVFHDAYQYFEKSFGFSAEGTVLRNPTILLSGKRLREIRENLTEKNIACIYYEPQFNPEIVEKFSKQFSLKLISVDPLAAGNEKNKDWDYFLYLDSLANSFLNCRS